MAAAGQAFQAALLARVLRAAAGNVPGGGDPGRRRLRDAATRAGLVRRRFDPEVAATRLGEILPHSAGLEAGMALLGDDASRALMLDVLAWRVLGDYHVALPVTAAQEEAHRRRMAALVVDGPPAAGPFGHALPLHEYRGIRMHASSEMLVAFEVGQYAPAQPGQTVVDGGAGFGETALVYAQQVGPEGRVVAVELDAANVGMIERNLALNPGLAERITLVHGALWNRSGEVLEYGAMGGQSSVLGAGAQAKTVAVDDLGLDRVDVLKLDVEAAEAEALRGAVATIARDRPRLEVAAYHRTDDLAVLPALITELADGYTLRLGHYSPRQEETILIATAA